MIERCIREFKLDGQAADLFRVLALTSVFTSAARTIACTYEKLGFYRDLADEAEMIQRRTVERATVSDVANNTRILNALQLFAELLADAK